MAVSGPRPLVAGNWKMNGTTAMLKEPRLLAGMLRDVKLKCEVLICPPATLIRRVKSVMKGSRIKVGGQDCHGNASGAHTGDISAEMLKDAGCTSVILGHSERRANHAETDEMVSAKAKAAHRAGLIAIVCIGETLDQRKGGKTLGVVSGQLKGSLPEGATPANTVVAYEPVLKMNIEEKRLANLLKTLPALRNPTIAQLSLPGWVAVETIIDEHIVREIIPQLKEAGAEGIIEYPLNKVVY